MARSKKEVEDAAIAEVTGKWIKQAHTAAARKQWDKAIQKLSRAAYLTKKAELWKQIAEWQVLQGDSASAIRTLENALIVHEKSDLATRLDLWLALAETQMSAQNWELGAQACGEMLRLNPRHHSALELLATAFLQMNRLDEAIETIGRLLQISPRDPLHRLKLATLFQLQGKLGEASREFQRVLDLSPAMPFAQDASEAVDALDRLQTQQILMMAAEQNAFRLNLERQFDLTLDEAGFFLSENGRESLRHMVADVSYELPTTPPRVH
jgi:tetratricopeptide (TPR) repeat protein